MDDPRLHVEDIKYIGETGDVLAHFAKPEGETKLPGVIVISEVWGLGPHIKDVSGVTNAYGTVSFKTRWLKDSGTLQFSVTDIVKTGWVYDTDVNMETWDSIESKRESTQITLLSYL